MNKESGQFPKVFVLMDFETYVADSNVNIRNFNIHVRDLRKFDS